MGLCTARGETAARREAAAVNCSGAFLLERAPQAYTLEQLDRRTNTAKKMAMRPARTPFPPWRCTRRRTSSSRRGWCSTAEPHVPPAPLEMEAVVKATGDLAGDALSDHVPFSIVGNRPGGQDGHHYDPSWPPACSRRWIR